MEGLEAFTGDVLLEAGMITGVGVVDASLFSHMDDLITVDANGAWVTPGYGCIY